MERAAACAKSQCAKRRADVAAKVAHSGALPVIARLRFEPTMIDTTISSADHFPKILRPTSLTAKMP